MVVCPLVLSVPAIVVGQAAKKEIDAAHGALGGRSQAQAGFVLGIVGTIWGLLAVLLFFLLFAVSSSVVATYEDSCSGFNESTGQFTDC